MHRPETEAAGVLAGARIVLPSVVTFSAVEAQRFASALRVLFGAAPPPPPLQLFLEQRGGDAVVVARDTALDCAASLLEAADVATSTGECVVAFALLGMESRLLEELVGEGRRRTR